MRPEMVLQLHTCLPHVHLLGGITWTTLYDHGDHLCFWAFPLCMNTATIVSMLTHKLRKKDWHSEILSLEIWMISYSVHWSEMYYSIWLEVFEKKKLDLTWIIYNARTTNYSTYEMNFKWLIFKFWRAYMNCSKLNEQLTLNIII